MSKVLVEWHMPPNQEFTILCNVEKKIDTISIQKFYFIVRAPLIFIVWDSSNT